MNRYLSGLTLITLLICMAFNLNAQTSVNDCLYINNTQKYVLSETVVSDNGAKQAINTLFIWGKDKVIRIVFVYDRRLAGLSQTRIHQLKTFDSFLPDFRKFILKDGPNNQQYFGVYYYWNLKNSNEIEDNGYKYSEKLKTAINIRNRCFNPLADKFGCYLVEDGNPEVMIPDPRRKDKLINNLPLLINSASGDSSYIISPLNIDIYRMDKNDIKAVYLKNLNSYKLYSSVSFMEPYYNILTGETYSVNNDKYIVYDKIRRFTLPYLYRFQYPIDTNSLLHALTLMPLSIQKRYVDNFVGVESRYLGKDKQTLELIKADSIRRCNVALTKLFTGNNFDYQYCPVCYDLTIPKLKRIRNHCPVKIVTYNYDWDENWSYSFSNENRHFFKVEKEYQSLGVVSIRTENDHNSWLMMSPGIGYWMSDVLNNDRNYIDKVNGLLLNGKAIH